MKVGCFALALVFAMGAPADARTRRYRKRSSAPLVLQPLLLARSAVHSVADKIVLNAPRVIATAATAPIRVAYRSTHDYSGAPVRRETSEQAEVDAEEDSMMRDVRFAPRVNYNQSMRVAYVSAHSGVLLRSQAAPPEEEASAGTDDEHQRQPPRAESSGSRPMVSGDRAVLRGAIAYAPSRAPQSVKTAIWAANTLRRKPYIWGGGHGSFYDHGYDCSGTVSFALHHAGALAAPLPSSDFLRYGESGRGRWITIYSRRGHTFATIAGLRLDTTDFENGGNTGPRWHVDGRDIGGYVARHPAGM